MELEKILAQNLVGVQFKWTNLIGVCFKGTNFIIEKIIPINLKAGESWRLCDTCINVRLLFFLNPLLESWFSIGFLLYLSSL